MEGTMPGEEKPVDHQFIRRSSAKPLIATVNRVVAYILNNYTGNDWSINKYKKSGTITLSWDGKNGRQQTSVRFDDIAAHIQNDRSFDGSRFNFPPPPNNWLDSSVGFAKSDGPIVSTDGTKYMPFALPLNFGNGFPVTPSIDREGIAFSTFQNQI